MNVKKALTPKQKAAEIEWLLTKGKTVEEILDRYDNLADGWPKVSRKAKANAIEALVNGGQTVDQIVVRLPQLAEGIEIYAANVQARNETVRRSPRGSGAWGFDRPGLSREALALSPFSTLVKQDLK